MYNYISIDDNGYFTGFVSSSTNDESIPENLISIGENEDPNLYEFKKYNKETKEWVDLTDEEIVERYGYLDEPSLEERMVAALEYYNLIME